MNDKFINKLYKDMIEKEFIKLDNNPSDLSQKKKIVEEYLDKLDRVSHKLIDREQIDRLKKLYYDRYVIKEENVPEEYFKKQEQLYLDRGYGHYTLNDSERKTLIDTIILEQKKSLDNILDYFLSEDSKFYPDKLKYWAFQGLLSLGNYDKEKKKYQRRNIHTVNPFIDFNREALALTINAMNSFINGSHIDEEVIKTDSFNKLYTYYINYLDSINKIDNKSTEGIWIKYNQGDDYQELLKSLQGKGTGWCTAAEETCKKQIQNGDFYVYYTKDNDNKYTNPRIAIRMEGSYQIAEIRGVANNQNLEGEMLPILDEKLKEFPDKDKYLKKVSDMEILTKVYNKHNKNKELSKEELLFLYEVHSSIQGFGYGQDPRIKEIKSTRNIKEDLVYALECSIDEIGIDMENFEKSQRSGKKLKYYDGNLNLSSLRSVKGLILPEILNGYLSLDSLQSAEGLVLPQTINGYLSLDSLQSAEGLVLPQTINGYLYLYSLQSAEGLVLPQTINGDLFLDSLERAEGLILPQIMNGFLNLHSLKSTEGLVLPKTLNGSLSLFSLESAEGLILPQIMNGFLNLHSLKSAEGLVLPKTLNGDLFLNSLESAEGLMLPEILNGGLGLSLLKSAEGLVLPKTLNGDLFLNSLESAKGLMLPEILNGCLSLNSLKSAEGLVLPKTLNGGLYLNILRLSEFYKLDFSGGFQGFIITLFGKFTIDELREYLEEHKNDNIGKHR